MFKLGEKSIKSLFYGNKTISKAYYGDKLVFQRKKKYTEVEYLQSTGTQFIDTGIKSNAKQNLKIKATVVNLDNNRKVIAGDYNTSGDFACSLEFGGTSNNKPCYLRGFCQWRSGESQTTVWSDEALPLNTKLDVEYEWSPSDKTIYITYLGKTSSFTKTTLRDRENPWGTLKLFLDNRGAVTAMANPLRICKLSMEIDGVLVRDFTARLDENNVAGMFDKVTEQFFYNKGTGEFLYG